MSKVNLTELGRDRVKEIFQYKVLGILMNDIFYLLSPIV